MRLRFPGGSSRDFGRPGFARTIGREIATFAYASAWRQAEVVGLTWDAVDRRSQEIRRADTKNDRPRLLPLTGDLAKLIERRWRRRA